MKIYIVTLIRSLIILFLLHYQINREDQESEVGVSSGAVAEGSVSSGDADDCFDGKETDKESKKKKNRCAVCRKKVGLTGEFATTTRKQL